jgi:hypothetical protein
VMEFPRHDGMTLIVRNVVADRHTLTRLHGKFSGTAGSEVALQSVLLLGLSFAASTTAPTRQLKQRFACRLCGLKDIKEKS